MSNCEKCKFYDIDYEWDDEYDDEVEIETCQKGHELPCENECEDFKRYREKKYKEEFSRCDTCENLKDCIADGRMLEITTGNDKSRHFMKGIIFGCKKDLEALKKYGIDLRRCKMCNFCKGFYIPADVYINSKAYAEKAATNTGVVLATNSNSKQKYLLFKVDGTDTQGGIKINYCPICGERLE